jgi:hypothetical protein
MLWNIACCGVYQVREENRMKQMEEDPRQEAQYDPRNKRTSSVKRIRWSFVLIVLIFLALGLTAVKIMTGQ